MADDKSFKELIAEQKRTNKLLMQQMASEEKGSKLGTSIKNSAGEIINDVLIGNKQKRESDETQTIIKKGNEEQKDLDEKNQKTNLKIFKTMSTALTGAFVNKKTGGARGKETLKDTFAMFSAFGKKYFGKSSVLGKGILGLKGYLGGLFKSLLGKGKGLLGFLATAVGYGLLLNYLNSEGFKEFIKGDAPKRIAEMARKIFGKDGALDRTAFHMQEIVDGFTDPNKSGFAALGAALKALREALFGKDGKKDGEEDGSLLGGMISFNNALLVIGGFLLLKALLPKTLFHAGLLLTGVFLISRAIKGLNEFLGFQATSLNKETGMRDYEDPSLDQVIPLTKKQITKLQDSRIYGKKGYTTTPKGVFLTSKFDGKATTTRAPPGTKGYGGNRLQRAMAIFDKAPDWIKRFWNKTIMRAPFIGKALLGLDLGKTLISDMPWDANPDQPSKMKSIMSLLGIAPGMTAGAMLGSLIPIPGAGSLAGLYLGGQVGQDIGEFAYKAMWLNNKGVKGILPGGDLLNALMTDTTRGVAGEDRTKYPTIFTNTKDKQISTAENTFGLAGQGYNFIKSMYRPDRNIPMMNNVNFRPPLPPAANDLEYLRKVNAPSIVINNLHNTTAGTAANIGNAVQRTIGGGLPQYLKNMLPTSN